MKIEENLRSDMYDTVENKPIKLEKKIDALGRSYSTGKRKNSIARVWIKKGSGKFTINFRDSKKYLCRDILLKLALMPFHVTDTLNKFDVDARVLGGGLSGQAGAISLGIARSLLLFTADDDVKSLLRKFGLLTRDSRIVERKKYGKKKARKGKTYRKR